MSRRSFITGALALALCGCKQEQSKARVGSLADTPPNKIRIVPDQWHIHHVGRLSDGGLFIVESQLDPNSGITKDFVCTYVFSDDGQLARHAIELVGERGSYDEGSVGKTIERHLAALGHRKRIDIWVRPFRIESHGVVFWLIPRQLEGGGWRVESMPGNTLSFYPPWAAGEYDT